MKIPLLGPGLREGGEHGFYTWKLVACIHLNIVVHRPFGIFTRGTFTILSDSISKFTVNVCYLNGLIQMQGAHHS